MASFKILIPKPCNENWDKMTPNENGRFCDSCAKSVVDFTTMLPDEIQHYFIQNKDARICGRFKKTQLNSVIIQIPNATLFSQTNYHKMFLLALFIAMGTTLFSCSDKNGNKQKIDKVEVVEDSKELKQTRLGLGLPSKTREIKFVKPAPTRCEEITIEKLKDTSVEKHITSGMVMPKLIKIDSTKTKDK
ncbi:MAG: hypothetical protein V4548_09925 [Bacteroidota bacterium]